MTTVIYLVFMIGIAYLIIVLPDKKRKKQYTNMVTNLKVNDEVITKGGFMGEIVSIKDDHVIIRSGPNKSTFKLSKGGIQSILTTKETVEVKEKVEETTKEV